MKTTINRIKAAFQRKPINPEFRIHCVNDDTYLRVMECASRIRLDYSLRVCHRLISVIDVYGDDEMLEQLAIELQEEFGDDDVHFSRRSYDNPETGGKYYIVAVF